MLKSVAGRIWHCGLHMLWVLFFLSHFLSESLAQYQCDPEIHAVSDLVLAYRPFGNRCEGFYTGYVSGTAISVVGLTIGPFCFKREANEVVTLRLPNHPAIKAHIEARAIAPKKYYRMDADLNKGDSLKWPIKDVILPASADLTSDRIGVCAYIDKNYKRIYVPVQSLAASQIPSTDKAIRLTVQVSEDIVRFMWRPTGIKQWSDYRRQGDGSPLIIKGGEPITIILPEHLKGAIELELAARPPDTDQWIKAFVELELGDGDNQ